ncbi:hypothetical protein XENOCAPTIV_003342 [Xenoophorus captivus]|uniref:Uncharacterized protein n=1 Tax=Xenoophorus captivus TaxID=1517983 RepID=A0ABV0QVK5_9TELE
MSLHSLLLSGVSPDVANHLNTKVAVVTPPEPSLTGSLRLTLSLEPNRTWADGRELMSGDVSDSPGRSSALVGVTVKRTDDMAGSLESSHSACRGKADLQTSSMLQYNCEDFLWELGAALLPIWLPNPHRPPILNQRAAPNPDPEHHTAQQHQNRSASCAPLQLLRIMSMMTI